MSMKEEYTAHDMATAAADGFRDGQRAAQSAPAGEREAFEAWAASVGYHTERDMFQREKYQSTLTWELWRVWQAGASWQRTQSAPPASPEGRECPRYVCRTCKQETRPPEPYKAYVLCDCGYMTSATTALAAAPQPAPTCATCSGVSLVGRNPDHGELCPECSGSTQPAAQHHSGGVTELVEAQQGEEVRRLREALDIATGRWAALAADPRFSEAEHRREQPALNKALQVLDTALSAQQGEGERT